MYDTNSPESLAITNAVVILPDRVIESGSVGIQDGLISEIAEGSQLNFSYESWIDARGAYLMPGLIDLHNDGLELEVNPRPETNLPVSMALSNMERRLLAAGVTTEFHAISFMDNTRNGRTISSAAQRAMFVAEYMQSGAQLIDNHILHRLDVWSPHSLDFIFESLSRMPVRYVSINDHTPGQGQYRDLEAFKERMVAWSERRGTSMAADEAERRMRDRAADTETVPGVYARLREESQRMAMNIASHDDDSPEKVDVLHELGAQITEFPVTVEAAQKAREHGMTIIVGAPNIVRGGSSSGNLSAAELFSLGLADVICADYHAPSMLPAAFRLVDDGLVDLATAIRCLTHNPARALELPEVGAIQLGYKADLILVRREASGIPLVERALRSGQTVLALNAPKRVEVAV